MKQTPKGFTTSTKPAKITPPAGPPLTKGKAPGPTTGKMITGFSAAVKAGKVKA